MESQTHCAYNQTRECFLGLEVKAVDLSAAHAAELMAARPLKSGEGVWMTPFRGIPPVAMPAPLDLIYLDEDCRVIDMVESFPTFQVSSSSPRPTERAGAAGALDLLVADPARRSTCAVRGRGDGAAIGAVDEHARRGGNDAGDCRRGCAAREAAVERRAGTSGTGRPRRAKETSRAADPQ